MATPSRVGALVQGAVRAPDETVRGATPAELVALEARLGRPLPAELAAFLSVCNGARIGPGGFFGQRPDAPSCDLPTVAALWPGWAQQMWLPVAGDGCGNYYLLTTEGDVGFVDTMEDPASLRDPRFPDLFTCVEWLLANDQADGAP
ncbi:SMI1/KNR4 family protein [Lapillicoccus jejuensis]|uniref:SMI1/KNR4 family protein SUKH-1 n=1 Tax=Lapillicoccus jejuensis TaxID=402171 RepID=A0A542E5H2_9MICO|nr:SMI1/KNR4 family protein [Lapillicoccus jejuensis]TQJ10534.1 SMI1/KNR4 family protein SUKH-1 [Lapillicoccus jejuensis]